jgi:DNA-binding protein H-NS
MARTYEQLQRQIAGLQAEAEKLRRKEFEGVVARIREAIEIYGITAADLGLAAGAPKRRGPAQPAGAAERKGKRGKRGKAGRKAGSAAAQFRDAAGNTWVGRGKRPQWLRDALVAGHTLDEFRIKAA